MMKKQTYEVFSEINDIQDEYELVSYLKKLPENDFAIRLLKLQLDPNKPQYFTETFGIPDYKKLDVPDGMGYFVVEKFFRTKFYLFEEKSQIPLKLKAKRLIEFLENIHPREADYMTKFLLNEKICPAVTEDIIKKV